MQFASEKKALNFIKFNSEEIRLEKGYAPTRAYYCEFCCCWHVSSKDNVESVSYFEKRDKERAEYYSMNKSDRAILLQEKADLLIRKMEQALNNGEIKLLDTLLMRYDKIKLRYNLTFKNQLKKTRAEELRILKQHIESIIGIPWQDRAEVINQLPVDIRDIVTQSATNHDFISIANRLISSMKELATEEGYVAHRKFKSTVKYCKSITNRIYGSGTETLKNTLCKEIKTISECRYRNIQKCIIAKTKCAVFQNEMCNFFYWCPIKI